MQEMDRETIENLKHSLFLESQYRRALVSDAISHYEANLTKDIIETDIIYRDMAGNLRSSLELVGLSAPCKFSDFITRYVEKFIDPDYTAKYEIFSNTRDFLIDLFNSEKRDYILEYWFTDRKGKELFLCQRFLLVENECGEICTLAVLHNTTHAKRIEAQKYREEVERIAYCDPITNDYNYEKFKKKMNEVEQSGSVISFDVNSFKIINAICGIGTGDDVIRAVWKRIIEVFDFSKGDLAAHINADRFIMFTPTEDRDEIISKIKAVSYAMNMISAELSVPPLKPFFGVSGWNPQKKLELSYSESMTAKNNAKKLQDKDYSFFEVQDMERLVMEERIIDSFEDALAQNEFNIWYQPKISTETHEMVGAEALARWFKNGKLYVSPADFIPLFENNGLIRRFDQYVFRNVCIQQKKWFDEGKKVVPVSINLSRISLYYKDIVEIYSHIADSVGIDKRLIPIEITETAAVTNGKIMDIAESFIKAGFVLHMDDFGSGYSSLSTLNSMHFESWKLDKSLIDSIGRHDGERLIVHIVQLAKELGVMVTAEGVETEYQSDFLGKIGCDCIQGYFYSKPVEKSQFEIKLKN